MSKPQPDLQREYSKPNSSHAIRRLSSTTATNWSGHSRYHGNPAYSQTQPGYAATTTPPIFSNGPRPYSHMESGVFSGYGPQPSQHDGQTLYPQTSAAPQSSMSSLEAFDSSRYPVRHPNIARVRPDASSTFGAAHTASTTRMRQPLPEQRPAFHESPLPYRSAPVTPTAASSISSNTESGWFVPVSERLHSGFSGTPDQHRTHGTFRRGMGQTMEVDNIPALSASYGANRAQFEDFHYPSRFSQPRTDQYLTFSSNYAPAFNQDFEHPLFQDPAYMGNLSFANATTSYLGSGIPAEESDFAGDPHDHTGFPSSAMQNVESALQAPLHLNAHLDSEPNSGQVSDTRVSQRWDSGGTNAEIDWTAAQAQTQEYAEQLAHEMHLYTRLQGSRSAARFALPAQVQHYTILPAADPSHDPDCPICQDPYDDAEHTAIRLENVACKHVFGHCCLQEWVNSGMQNAHKCPSCRQSLAGALAASRLNYPSYQERREQILRTFRDIREQRGRQESGSRVGQAPLQTPVPTTTGLGAAADPSAPTTLTTPNQQQTYRSMAHDLMNRMMERHRQQLARFDDEAAARTANVQATGPQEAHALATRITYERVVLLSRQQAQITVMRERVARHIQESTRNRARRQI